jgi:succinyl-diaminopimelate desuccinylase
MGIDHAALLQFTQDLVRIPSVYDPDNGRTEEPAARLVWQQLRGMGMHPVYDEVAPGRPNVYGMVDGGLPGPTLCFEGHTDVVTEGDLGEWTRPPWGAEIEDGLLYGRGSADMKGGLAAAIFAARAVADTGPFPGRILIAALVDEEGMMIGAKHFVATGQADDVDAAIICEPEAGEVCNVSKGALRLHVTFHGAMAHGAMPHQGRNPHPAVGRFLLGLAALESEVQARHGRHEHLGLSYLTPTVLRGGDPAQMNVIPSRADMWVDVRTIPGQDHGDLVAAVSSLAVESGAPHGVEAVLDVLDDRPAVLTPPDAPVVQALWDAHASVTGETPRLGGVPGATDGTVLTARTGMPTVVYGPGGKWIAHQADEHVAVADISRAAEVYVEAALRYLRGA